MFDLRTALQIFVPLVLSLSVHEWAHAWSAWKLGDDTAARMGRLTLNPLAHIDPIGTVILPLLGIPFGWAKPVPVNPARFRSDISMGTGMAITASAGPISNVLLAVLCTVVLGLLRRLVPEAPWVPAAEHLLVLTITINVGLALFNLIPVPPLDGSRIVDGLMPVRLRPQWEAFTRVAPVLLIGIFFFGGRLIAGPSRLFLGLLQRLLDVIT